MGESDILTTSVDNVNMFIMQSGVDEGANASRMCVQTEVQQLTTNHILFNSNNACATQGKL